MKNDVKLKSADMAKQHTAASKTADQKNLKYRIIIKGTDNLNPFDELIKVFLRPDEYILVSEAASEDAYGADRNGSECRDIKTFIFEQQEDKDVTRQEIFDRLGNKKLHSIGKRPTHCASSRYGYERPDAHCFDRREVPRAAGTFPTPTHPQGLSCFVGARDARRRRGHNKLALASRHRRPPPADGR